jgi:hypothetical protein
MKLLFSIDFLQIKISSKVYMEEIGNYILSDKPLATLQIRYLCFLQQIKFKPNVFYDIGASHCAWTNAMKTLFPESTIVLFDASHHLGSLYENDLHYFNCFIHHTNTLINHSLFYK